MGNKIIVEFDRKKIEKNCNRYFCLDCEKHCKQTDKDLIRCYLNWNDFKIKEQIEERDMYKDAYCSQCKKEYSICELKKQKNIVCCSLFKEREQNNGN